MAAGRVTVGGEVVTDPARDVGEGDEVRVDGSLVGAEAREVWAVNKPAGVVSTAREPGSRPAVVELVDSGGPPLSGRPPRRRLDRAAAADQRRRAGQPADPSALRSAEDLPGAAAAPAGRGATCGACASGVELEDGPTAPAEVRRLGEREIEIVLREGRNRQVRRMAEAVGNEVVALRRVRFGPLELGELAGARRAASPRPRLPCFGKMRRHEHELSRTGAALRRARRGPGGRQRARGDPRRDGRADARAARAQRARAGGDGQLPLHDHRATSTPSSPPSPRASSASTRCRCSAAARSRSPARCRG